jgi:hypothetical protein
VPRWRLAAPPQQARVGDSQGMFRAIRNLLLYRVLGGRIMLAVALLGFARRLLGSRRKSPNPPSGGTAGAYQPSQGSSQTVQRDPR